MILDIKAYKPNFKTQAVSVEELQEGAEILIRELTGAVQAELVAMMQAKKSDMDIAALLFSKTIIAEDGHLLLATADEARDFIAAIPARTFNRLNKAMWQLNNGDAEKKA